MKQSSWNEKQTGALTGGERNYAALLRIIFRDPRHSNFAIRMSA